jgi:hypothetical protein
VTVLSDLAAFDFQEIDRIDTGRLPDGALRSCSKLAGSETLIGLRVWVLSNGEGLKLWCQPIKDTVPLEPSEQQSDGAFRKNEFTAA